MGLEPRTFSAGSPMKRMVPVMPCFSMAALAASAPTSEPMPSAECGSVWPPAKRERPLRGWRHGTAAWQLPGTASYSA